MAEAEGAGVPFVHVTSTPGSEAAVGAAVAATTSAIRIIVGVHLGDENPVTLAEEIAVLDNLSNGRVAVIAELGSLPAGAADRGRVVAPRGAERTAARSSRCCAGRFRPASPAMSRRPR